MWITWTALVGTIVESVVSEALINLNKRVKELFSLTRLGEVMAEGRDPKGFGIP
jgi:hypothetical protein